MQIRKLHHHKMKSWEMEFRNNLREFCIQNEHIFQEESPVNKAKRTASEQIKDNCWKVRYQRLYRKFQNLYEDMRLITSFSLELIMAVEKSAKGELTDFSAVLSSYKKIHNSIDNTTEIPSVEGRMQDEADKAIAPSSPTCTFYIQELDIEKIKNDLYTGNVKTKLLLLQALRWGITRSATDERHSVVWLITQHNLLHLHDENVTFLQDMLVPDNGSNAPHPTQQTTVRLLNALVAVKMGFDYVACPQVVELLAKLVRNCEYIESDTITSDLLVALLQKISWVYYLGELMIERNLMEWLIKKLCDAVEWNYALRNGLLLLLSLTGHRAGKRVCLNLADELLAFLAKFLGGEYKSTETCGSIFWKFCAYLENVLMRKDCGEEDWTFMAQKFSLTNSYTLCSYLHRQEMQNENNFEAEIEANDPLTATPNGAEFLRQHYNLC